MTPTPARMPSTARRAPLAILPFVAACASAPAHPAAAPGGYSYAYASGTGGGRSSAPCPAGGGWSWSDRPAACEVRTFVLRADGGPVDVESGNGAIAVDGADTARAVSVVARVRVWAPSEDEARQLLGAVAVAADGNTLRARADRGRFGDDRRWAVDYAITAPRRLDVLARTGNGSVHVRDVVGRLRLASGNGSVALDRVGGDVDAGTGNGSVLATLAGRAWDTGGLPGAGLTLHSGNGSAMLRVPDGYSARLDVSSGNGGLSVDIPVTVQGRIDRHRLAVTLGEGGAPVRVSTGNGRVRIARVE